MKQHEVEFCVSEIPEIRDSQNYTGMSNRVPTQTEALAVLGIHANTNAAVSSKGSPEHQDSPNSYKKTPKRSPKGKKRGNQSTSPKKKLKKIKRENKKKIRTVPSASPTDSVDQGAASQDDGPLIETTGKLQETFITVPS